MTHLAPIELDDGTIIYIEADDELVQPQTEVSSEETTRPSKGALEDTLNQFQAMQGTIRSYTAYTLNAFKEIAAANVDKVTLEFGIKVSGEAGVPYVTKGSGTSNLKITVECSFPQKQQNQS